MAYTVLARRYRSQTFDDVVGQDAIAHTLKNAIQSERVAHAYLFTGTRGVGKTTMARILAKSLNCLSSDGPTVSPCLTCDSCRSVNTGEDLDVQEIDGASNNGVDNIRQLRQNAIYRPARARFKIYIIDEVHMLSTGAFNALLKILEEPPAHVKFIFATTEPNKVLPTIQSRCQRFDFAAIGPATIAEQFRKVLKEENIEFEDDVVLHLARLANGSMRDGLSLMDQLISSNVRPLTVKLLMESMGQPDGEKLRFLMEHIASANGAGVLEGIDTLIGSGQTAGQICDSLLESLRDLMVLKAAGRGSAVLTLTEQEKTQLEALARGFDLPGIIYAITALERLRWNIRNSETGRTLLEAALLRLALSEHFLGLDQAAAVSSAGASDALKKKSQAASNLTPAAAAAAPSAVQVTPPAAPPKTAPSLACPDDIAACKASWPSFLERLSAHEGALSNYLSQSQPAALNNGELTLRFASSAAFAMELCRKRTEEVERFWQTLFGRQVELRFALATAEDEKAAAAAASNGAAAKAPKPALDRRQKAKLLDDPQVQMVLRELNATPIEVQEVEEEFTEVEDTTESELL